jgi:AmiR/NasT family two-component response regulator
MTTPLLLDLTAGSEAGWRAALGRLPSHLGVACNRDNLVQCTIEEAPDLIICLAPGLTAELLAALSGRAGAVPSAVLLLTPRAPTDAREAIQAIDLGIHHWMAASLDVDGNVSAADMEVARATALARWRREKALQEALRLASEQMEERKWVDRAKGVLMSARGMAEDDAFRLLRGAAMNVNLRVGEVSRAVTEAAQWADALNRAGQLRMLSQRFVRLVAQRLLKIDVRNAATLEQQSAARMRDNLEMLSRQCAGTSTQADYATAVRCWEALAAALAAPRIDQAALLRIDHRADELLVAAEQLTESLQGAAGRRALHIVNECGRQRMRVQRVAKDSLLAALHRSVDEGATLALRRDVALDDFERAQGALEAAPLSSPEIRATLAQVRDEWLRLLGGLRADETGDGRRALVHASETMLERLDALTAAYEHSVQVIMG